ncbi:hypothetical protein SGPA1_20404 [Streptomyces misionensis JCM 4497]
MGQPALLAAARLARGRARAALDHGGRRDHGRVHLPHRGGPGLRPGVRHGDGGDPAHRHQRRPAHPAGLRRGRAARGHHGRHRGRHPEGRAAAGRGHHPRAEDHRRGRPGGLGDAGAARGPGGARLHSGARRLDHLPRRAAQAHPGHPGARPDRPRARTARGRQEQRARGHRLPRRRAPVGPGAGQEADARGRLGPGSTDRGGRDPGRLTGAPRRRGTRPPPPAAAPGPATQPGARGPRHPRTPAHLRRRRLGGTPPFTSGAPFS